MSLFGKYTPCELTSAPRGCSLFTLLVSDYYYSFFCICKLIWLVAIFWELGCVTNCMLEGLLLPAVGKSRSLLF